MTSDTLIQKHLFRVPLNLLFKKDLYINFSEKCERYETLLLTDLLSLSQEQFDSLASVLLAKGNRFVMVANNFDLKSENTIIEQFTESMAASVEYLLSEKGFIIVPSRKISLNNLLDDAK